MVKEPIGSTASCCHLFRSMGRVARKLVATPKCPRPLALRRCHLFGSMGRVARKLVATPKCPRPLILRHRLAASSPSGIRRLSKEALRQHLMNNSLDISGNRQQMVSRLTAFSKAAKAHSEDQRPESRQALDQHLEDNRRDNTSTYDSSEARDPIAHKNDSGSDSSEAPGKPQSKPKKKTEGTHPLDKLLRRSLSQKKAP